MKVIFPSSDRKVAVTKISGRVRLHTDNSDQYIRVKLACEAQGSRVFAAKETIICVTRDGRLVSMGPVWAGGRIDLDVDQYMIKHSSVCVQHVYTTDCGVLVVMTDGNFIVAGARCGDWTGHNFAEGKITTAGDTFFITYCGRTIQRGGPEKDRIHMNEFVKIRQSHRAWLAVDAQGKIHTWGLPEYGGDSRQVLPKILAGGDIQDIYSTDYAFLVTFANGSPPVSWGARNWGGNSIWEDLDRNEIKTLGGSLDDAKITPYQFYSSAQMFVLVKQDRVIISGHPADCKKEYHETIMVSSPQIILLHNYLVIKSQDRIITTGDDTWTIDLKWLLSDFPSLFS